MAATFDPYHKWLGIPPKDQPPNNYRLLGIEVFEDDRDVIDAAANRIMAYLKDLAAGDEGEHSQKLLNEIARARVCLLNRESKREYDEVLRTELAAKLPHANSVAVPPQAPEPTPPPSGPAPPAQLPPPPMNAPPAVPIAPQPHNAPQPHQAPPPYAGPQSHNKPQVPNVQPSSPGSSRKKPPKKKRGPSPRPPQDPFHVGENPAVRPLADAGSGKRRKKKKTGADSGIMIRTKDTGGAHKHRGTATPGKKPNLGKRSSQSYVVWGSLGVGVALILVSVVLLAVLGGGGNQDQTRPNQQAERGGPSGVTPRVSRGRREGNSASRAKNLPQGGTELKGFDLSFNSSATGGPTSGFGMLAGYWPMDDDIDDRSPRQLSTTLTDKPAFVTGSRNKALQLTADQKLHVEAPLATTSSECSIGFWINLAAIPSTDVPIFDFGGMAIHLTNGLVKVRVAGNEPVTGPSTDANTAAFNRIQLSESQGNWLHLVIVYSSPMREVHFYENGTYRGYQRFRDSAPAALTQMTISNIGGAIDDIYVLDHCVGSDGVKAIHAGDYQPSPPPPNSANGEFTVEVWDGSDAALSRREIDKTVSATADTTTTSSPQFLAYDAPAPALRSLIRIRGYLFPEESGDFQFRLEGTSQGVFYLEGKDEASPTLREMSAARGRRSNLSEVVSLNAGEPYYFEIFFECRGGKSDNVQLNWTTPSSVGQTTAPVPATAFAPYLGGK